MSALDKALIGSPAPVARPLRPAAPALPKPPAPATTPLAAPLAKGDTMTDDTMEPLMKDRSGPPGPGLHPILQALHGGGAAGGPAGGPPPPMGPGPGGPGGPGMPPPPGGPGAPPTHGAPPMGPGGPGGPMAGPGPGGPPPPGAGGPPPEALQAAIAQIVPAILAGHGKGPGGPGPGAGPGGPLPLGPGAPPPMGAGPDGPGMPPPPGGPHGAAPLGPGSSGDPDADGDADAGPTLEKSAVNYRPADTPSQSCATCVHFIKGKSADEAVVGGAVPGGDAGACDLVTGPVLPQGTCDRYEPVASTKKALVALATLGCLIKAVKAQRGASHEHGTADVDRKTPSRSDFLQGPDKGVLMTQCAGALGTGEEEPTGDPKDKKPGEKPGEISRVNKSLTFADFPHLKG